MPKPNIIRYEHHGKEVAVREDLQGQHRDHCLCWRCTYFTPDERTDNCPIANELYALCRTWGLATPVWECNLFEEKEC